MQSAIAREDARFEQGEDDSEGLGVTSRPSSPLTETESDCEAEVPTQPAGLGVVSRPSSPLTEIESDSGAEVPAQPDLGSSGPSDAKKRRNEGAKKRRAKKRARLASSGHQPHAYAANPSTVAHRAEELKPLQVLADARDFPSSGSGSWVGRRQDGAKKVPWTVPELVEMGFTFVEWDGW